MNRPSESLFYLKRVETTTKTDHFDPTNRLDFRDAKESVFFQKDNSKKYIYIDSIV